MDKNWMKNFASFVKNTRKKMGLSQEDLAKATGMNTSYISRLEKGTNFQSVKIDFFIKLVDTFDMDEMAVLKEVGLR